MIRRDTWKCDTDMAPLEWKQKSTAARKGNILGTFN
jgi:hypothetical protein